MNRTEEMYLDNTEDKEMAAIEAVEEFIKKQGVTGKQALHLRLLTEEAIGMVRAMTGDFTASIYMEEENGEYRLRLNLRTYMDIEKKSELLSVATSGKNAAAKGFMGKMKEIVENGLLNYDYMLKLQQEYGTGYTDYISMGMGVSGDMFIAGNPITWSLNSYREALSDAENEEPAQEAWDEIEKSIVASLAKDVIVGIKKDLVEMTIVAA
ncbi:MAG: hypothetical protein K5857_03300 [Lachnospiraceae bacterium]|nr:hypothetical protein [Lachnospiraceae bacterium]